LLQDSTFLGFDNAKLAFGIITIGNPLAFFVTLLIPILFLGIECLTRKRGIDPYNFFLSFWVSRLLLGLTIILAPRQLTEFIYFNF